MALKDIFQRKNKTIRATESKSNPNVGDYQNAPFSFCDFLTIGGQGDLRAAEATRLWKKCTPFYQSVMMRAEALSSIPIRVYDTENKEFVPTHPILDLLKNPNPEQSGLAFLKAYSSFYDIAGEAFLVATGDKGSEPLEVFLARPQDVTIQASTKPEYYGAAGNYSWSTSFFMEKYRLDTMDELGGSFRYWNRDENRQIWQAKEFNPSSSANCLRGFSKAAPLWLQIQQFIEADTNNFSVLSRGARPSVAWVNQLPEPLTDEQFERWKEQVTSYEGAINAGRQVLVDNVKPEIISTTNKDMEFSQNRKTVRDDIFSAFAIPLPLISSANMTLDNLKVSNLLFFEQSVLPHADNLLDELTRFLMPRYKDSENLILSFNPIDIQALKDRAILETAALQKSYILTVDELRTRVGYEGLASGGDTVLIPSQLLPGGEDANTDDELDRPDNGEKSRQLEAFREHTKAITRSDGSRVFSDAEVDVMAREQGLLD